jgi:hypothetical protein
MYIHIDIYIYRQNLYTWIFQGWTATFVYDAEE